MTSLSLCFFVRFSLTYFLLPCADYNVSQKTKNFFFFFINKFDFIGLVETFLDNALPYVRKLEDTFPNLIFKIDEDCLLSIDIFCTYLLTCHLRVLRLNTSIHGHYYFLDNIKKIFPKQKNIYNNILFNIWFQHFKSFLDKEVDNEEVIVDDSEKSFNNQITKNKFC